MVQERVQTRCLAIATCVKVGVIHRFQPSTSYDQMSFSNNPNIKSTAGIVKL
jgi:hypothetical protein